MTRSFQRVFISVITGLLLNSGLAIAQSGYTPAETPPVAQPLVREGDFAIQLAAALKLGTVTSEAEAESILGSVGIVPKNGWIADYPVTPDILGELQASVADAANAGKLAMGNDAAMKATLDVSTGFNLSIKANALAPPQGGTVPAAASPESSVINNYYYDEGPPVVTYYSPPPDYAYMYTWVPYPFWWWDFWYPGYFILVDFHVRVHGRGEHPGFISNHFRDTRTGGVVRIDPANRSGGGTLSVSGRTGLTSPTARRGAQAILNSSQGRVLTGPSRAFRGYGERPSAGTRPSAFDRSRNSRYERAASDRGFQSRSNAGRIIEGGRGERGVSRSVTRRDDRRGPGDDGGGFHGGGRR